MRGKRVIGRCPSGFKTIRNPLTCRGRRLGVHLPPPNPGVCAPAPGPTPLCVPVGAPPPAPLTPGLRRHLQTGSPRPRESRPEWGLASSTEGLALGVVHLAPHIPGAHGPWPPSPGTRRGLSKGPPPLPSQGAACCSPGGGRRRLSPAGLGPVTDEASLGWECVPTGPEVRSTICLSPAPHRVTTVTLIVTALARPATSNSRAV